MTVSEGAVDLPDASGIGFELKAKLFGLFRSLTG